MRGLAMILIAVAVLLAAWALWSMMGKDDSSTVTSSEQTQSTETNAGITSGESTAASPAPSSVAPASSAEDKPEEQAAEQPESSAPAPAPAPAAQNGTPVTTLHVLNNSTVPQLAARVADTLSGDYEHVESGNLPDTVIPENTVYFTRGNAEAEKAARELADRVNGVAKERDADLPKETEGKDAIVLVLVQDVTL